jgi:hypothetical protein
MKSKISSAITASGFALLTPVITVFAQRATTTAFASGGFFDSVIDFIERMMTGLFPLISAGLILTFGYLVFMFLKSPDLEKKDQYKGMLIKAIIAIFLWFTLFGLIKVLASVVGVDVGENVGADEIPGVAL